MLELRWTDWSIEHIAARFTPEEVEEVCYTHPRARDAGRDDTVLLWGTTDTGRYALVVLSPDPGGRTAFVVTAREMTPNERSAFRKKKKF